MKRVTLLAAAAALSLARSVAAQAAFPDAYALLYELFGGADPNEGQTVFLSALVPMGGLGEGLAGAYTAVPRDNSFIEYNPAAAAALERTELALYHNNWIADSRVESVVYAVRFGELGLAAAGKWLYLPFTEYDQYADPVAGAYYSEAIATGAAAIRLFPGYYFYGVALGASVKAAYRSFPDFDLDDDGTLEPGELGTGAEQSAFALMLDAGALTRFNIFKFYSSRTKNAALGLAVRNVGAPAKGEPLPTLASVGLSYSPLRPFLFSADVTQPINLVDPASSERLYWSVGALAKLTDFLSLQGGFQLKGGNPRLAVGASIEVAPLTLLVNYGLDLATTFGPLNRVSLEARFDLGDRGRADLAKEVDELYLKGLDAYALGDSPLAVQYWNQALLKDRAFDPARESLGAAEATLALLRQLEELRRFGADEPAAGPAPTPEGNPEGNP